jgi:hypothetical protein
LQVILGNGKAYADEIDLYEFFNAMLEFQSETTFSTFMQNGYSLVVRAGTHNELVAAASFILQPDDLFIDAMVVSHGTHPNPCKLRGKSPKTFQNCGLGSFLIALLSRVATVRCTSIPSVYLKANEVSIPFYSSLGFQRVPKSTSLPEKLFLAVPMINVTRTAETDLLVYHPLPESASLPVESQDEVAASLLTTFKVPPKAASATNKNLAKKQRKKRMRDKCLVSLPQGHKGILFHPDPPPNNDEVGQSTAKASAKSGVRKLRGEDDATCDDGITSVAYYDRQDNVTASLLARMKHDLKQLKLLFVAPPPKADT